MNLTVEQIWTAAGVVLGFQVTAFSWRISRELEIAGEGDFTWLPVADMLNLASMLIILGGVFILPVLNIGDLEISKRAFGLAALLFVGYAFTLAGHYEMYNKNTRYCHKKYFPLQERVVLTIVVLVVIIYLASSLIGQR